MSPLLVAGSVAVVFPLAAWLVGSTLLRRVDHLDPEERLACGFGLGIAVLAAAQFLAFAAGLGQATMVVGVLLVAAGGLLAGRTRASAPPLEPWLLPVLVLAYLHLLLIEAVLPIYYGGHWYFDWWMHYDENLVFLGERSLDTVWARAYTIASRNPLFNLATTAPMALAGAPFWVFQAALSATNIAVVLALYLVLRDLFGRRTAFAGCGLASLNLWLMHLAWFSWSKTLVGFYLLLALHFHLRALRRSETDTAGARFDFAAFWLASGLAFLTHQLAAPYVVALLLHGVVRAYRRGELAAYLGPRRIVAYAAASFALLLPWYGWLVAHFGLRQMARSSPLIAMNNEPVTAISLVRSMASNALHSIVPILGDLPRLGQWVALQRWVTSVYFNQFVGAVTATQILFLLALAAARLAGRPWPAQAAAPPAAGLAAVAAFGVLGLLLSLPIHPLADNYGIVPANLFPATLALLVWSIGMVGRFAGRRLLLVILAATALEYLVMFWSHLAAITWFADPGDRNAQLKATNGLVFFADLLGPAYPVAAVALLGVQLALAGLVARRTWALATGAPLPTDSRGAPPGGLRTAAPGSIMR